MRLRKKIEFFAAFFLVASSATLLFTSMSSAKELPSPKAFDEYFKKYDPNLVASVFERLAASNNLRYQCNDISNMEAMACLKYSYDLSSELKLPAKQTVEPLYNLIFGSELLKEYGLFIERHCDGSAEAWKQEVVRKVNSHARQIRRNQVDEADRLLERCIETIGKFSSTIDVYGEVDFEKAYKIRFNANEPFLNHHFARNKNQSLSSQKTLEENMSKTFFTYICQDAHTDIGFLKVSDYYPKSNSLKFPTHLISPNSDVHQIKLFEYTAVLVDRNKPHDAIGLDVDGKYYAIFDDSVNTKMALSSFNFDGKNLEIEYNNGRTHEIKCMSSNMEVLKDFNNFAWKYVENKSATYEKKLTGNDIADSKAPKKIDTKPVFKGNNDSAKCFNYKKFSMLEVSKIFNGAQCAGYMARRIEREPNQNETIKNMRNIVEEIKSLEDEFCPQRKSTYKGMSAIDNYDYGYDVSKMNELLLSNGQFSATDYNARLAMCGEIVVHYQNVISRESSDNNTNK